ncbi:hypothetical protein [Massilia sp. BSC265]|uniref:hypothetical protein n=1 Tax=Massilia sp. BSC265 TaxID=1549812 RepID=UPI0004E8E1AA|nr:hypothetical protein [Massilia sp. BSC265]KFI07511.1 hypothetical protein JN27_07855 [Massilia sp. BSC265]
MALPELSLQFVYARLAWALVLAALVIGLWPASWRLPRRALGAIVAACLLLMALPGAASPAWHLGLAFQYPSGLLAGLCVVMLHARWRRAPGPVPAALPVPLAALLAVAGVLLYLDAFGLIAGGYYYGGFGGRAALAAVLLAGACAVAAARGRFSLQAGAILGALALFSFARLPSGNLWDALIDPLLWGWALVALAGAALRVLRIRLLRPADRAAAAGEAELPALQPAGAEQISSNKE